MIGAIIGDILGSTYEVHNIKSKEFEIFTEDDRYTDDSVLTCAVANACVMYQKDRNLYKFKRNLIIQMQRLGLTHPYAGYGGMFVKWLLEPVPYNSFGNGSAMRVSPIAWISETLEDTLYLAKISAEVSHNHEEGIKGAQAVAATIFLLRSGMDKVAVKKYINDNFYRLDFTLDEIRDTYKFDVTCQGSVPQALQAFFEANSFEDTIRNAISIGGDSDTIAAIAGSVAEAYYEVPKEMIDIAMTYLDVPLEKSVLSFYENVPTVKCSVKQDNRGI